MKTIPIETPSDFEDVAGDILYDFVDSFSEHNGCRGRTNSEGAWQFSPRGQELYERYIERLRKIGEARFPGHGADMNIRAWNVRDDMDDDEFFDEED